MDTWKSAVQAQLFFANQALHKLEHPNGKAESKAQQKYDFNVLVLLCRELWICCLNEWADLLESKRSPVIYLRWEQFDKDYAQRPELALIQEDLARADSWAAGFVELEQLSAKQWLSSFDSNNSFDEQSSQFKRADGLSLVSVESRKLSVLSGLEDIRAMLNQLKAFILQARSRHEEW